MRRLGGANVAPERAAAAVARLHDRMLAASEAIRSDVRTRLGVFEEVFHVVEAEPT